MDKKTIDEIVYKMILATEQELFMNINSYA